MKKLIVLIALSLFVAGPAFAAGTAFTDGAPSGTTVTGVLNNFRTSKNVTINGLGDATTYAATSKHLNGDRIYGSASGDSKIHYKESAKGTATPAPGGSTAAAFGTGWSAL